MLQLITFKSSFQKQMFFKAALDFTHVTQAAANYKHWHALVRAFCHMLTSTSCEDSDNALESNTSVSQSALHLVDAALMCMPDTHITSNCCRHYSNPKVLQAFKEHCRTKHDVAPTCVMTDTMSALMRNTSCISTNGICAQLPVQLRRWSPAGRESSRFAIMIGPGVLVRQAGMSTRFRHLRLVCPWSSVVRQYFGHSETSN